MRDGVYQMKPWLSIIIVHYQARQALVNCLKSLSKVSDQTPFEVIVINNDQGQLDLPSAKVINSPTNLGYGQGNNLGAKKAQGKYLWFLNPDTLVKSGTIDALVGFMEKNPKVGLVAPTIVHANGRRYKIQGSTDLTPLTAFFSHSALVKIWPNNPLRRRHLLQNTNPNIDREVGAVPGSVLMIRRQLFNKIGRFDKNFFLYFEEHDLCLRVRKAGKQVFLLAKPKVVHIGGQSSLGASTKKHFDQSRRYYFRKHFGW